MAGENPTAAIVNIAVSLMPEILALFRARRRALPGGGQAPELTDAEVLAGLRDAVASSITRDDIWLSQHPAEP